MLLSSIPDSIITAGLVGVIIALFVATAQQKWECKVFFLLALRLAIGWHFLFEGLHKINSDLTGPTETNKPFTSEPYFKVAPTAFGGVMREKFVDTQGIIKDRVKAPKAMTAAEFKALSAADQAAACPESVAKELDKLAENADADLKEQLEAAKKRHEFETKTATSEELKAVATRKLDETVKAIEEKQKKLVEITADKLTAARAKYAAWVYGTVPRDSKVKFVTGEVPYSAPQRLQQLEAIRNRIETELQNADRQRREGLGLGNGVEVKRVSELRTDLITAETDLAKDANAYVAELRKDILGWDLAVKTNSQGKRIDQFTMWFIAVVGGCILFGFCTRVSCVLAAGFLLMTYLSHPPFPWYILPPGTEGNPLFINKNIIECLALLALACYPTGRWLGLDAILHRLFHSRQYLELENRATHSR